MNWVWNERLAARTAEERLQALSLLLHESYPWDSGEEMSWRDDQASTGINMAITILRNAFEERRGGLMSATKIISNDIVAYMRGVILAGEDDPELKHFVKRRMTTFEMMKDCMLEEPMSYEERAIRLRSQLDGVNQKIQEGRKRDYAK